MSLQIALQNQTSSNNVNAYITGQAIDNDNRLFLLEADGKTPYYPASPSSTVQPLQANCAIPLGAAGNTVYVTIPHLAGARLWFCINDTLNFYLNPGPGLVEPSVLNSSDSNINKNWGFCEFTFNSSQLYANISYVDFVSIPIALTLTTSDNGTKHVSGMPSNGLQTVMADLQAQSRSDGQPWGSMAYNNLRVLSPNSYIGQNSGAFNGYYQDYVNQCWSKYAGTDLTLDTQAQWGTLTGRTNGNVLDFGNGLTFAKPSAADIFSCSSGPFAPSGSQPAEGLNIGARLAAALNRTTLLEVSNQPDGQTVAEYYQNNPTNWYSKVLHEVNLDHLGYGFPYDDVTPGQSGFVNDGAPQLWTVAVGGGNATADVNVAAQRQTELMANAKNMASLPVDQQLQKSKGGAPAAPAPTHPASDKKDSPVEATPAPQDPEAQQPPQQQQPKKSFSTKVKALFTSCFSARKKQTA